MATPDQQRAVAGYLAGGYKISQRRVARVIGRSRSTLRYDRRHRLDDPPPVRDIKRLARRHPRFGYRRLHAMLGRVGRSVNLKRVGRLWIELGLRRPIRRRKPAKLGAKPGVGGNSCARKPARFKDDVWTCDFVQARARDGRAFRMPNVIDEYTRECPAIVVARKPRSDDVLHRLAGPFGSRGVPGDIRSDNGPEFAANAVRDRLGRVGAETPPIEPGSPWEDGSIESFDGELRDELQGREVFGTPPEATGPIERWRVAYNAVRPHSGLGYRPPAPGAIVSRTPTFGTALLGPAPMVGAGAAP